MEKAYKAKHVINVCLVSVCNVSPRTRVLAKSMACMILSRGVELRFNESVILLKPAASRPGGQGTGEGATGPPSTSYVVVVVPNEAADRLDVVVQKHHLTEAASFIKKGYKGND